MRTPGYRDRVVHVAFAPDEGGMNLTMPPQVITALTARGRSAATKLVRRFADPPESPSALSWDSHRWTRYRTGIAALAGLVSLFERGYSAPPDLPGERTYAELALRPDGEHPRAYPWARSDQRQLGVSFTESMVSASDLLDDAAPERLDEDAPKPLPEARIVPRD